MRDLVIYCRTSMTDQNTETQRMALRDYCQRMGYQITDEYIDNGFSGKDQNRPQFERLLNDIRAGKVKCVLVYKLDRIGRSLQHLISLFANLVRPVLCKSMKLNVFLTEVSPTNF